MEKKYEKLIKNTSIFAIGTFSSKILVFLIVPLYTYVLSTTDYGIIDLIISSISLMIPFTTLLIYEAAIRFLVGKESNEKTIFNNCIFIFLIGCISSICFSPIILYFLKLSHYSTVFIVLLILTNYTTIFGQYLRANNDNWSFSISGIINTLCTVSLNLIFLLILKKGIVGYLWALLLSQLITSIYIFIKSKTLKLLNLKCINFKYLKKMLVYTLPLIPNNIMWWIMNAGDKYVINYYLGASANGIFSISYKVPTIITMLFSIFMQAWQVSAIEEKVNNSENTFYKIVFEYISVILIAFTSVLIVFIEPLFKIIISNEYISAWKYVPLLCVATLLNCFATFAGIVYIIEKNSKKSLHTTFIGATINLILNFLLIRHWGLFGVAIGTAVGYLSVMLLRFKDFKKFFNLSLIDFNFILALLILIADSIIYMFMNNIIKYVISFICVFIILIISRKKITNIIKKLKRKLKKRK